VLKDVPRTKAKEVAAMLKAIHAQEDREAALAKAKLIEEKLLSRERSTNRVEFIGVLGD
jgi:ribosomal protein L4